VLWEEILDVVGFVVLLVESVWRINLIVWSVTIASVGVTVVVDDWVVWVVLELVLLIVVSVAVGELVGVLHVLDKNVLVVLVDWVVVDLVQLEHSNLTSGISGSTESEVLDNSVLWVSGIKDFLVVSLIAVAEIVTWLVVLHLLGLVLKLKLLE